MITNDANQPLFNGNYTMSNIVKLYDKVRDAFNTWIYDIYPSTDINDFLKNHPSISVTGSTQNNGSQKLIICNNTQKQ